MGGLWSSDSPQSEDINDEQACQQTEPFQNDNTTVEEDSEVRKVCEKSFKHQGRTTAVRKGDNTVKRKVEENQHTTMLGAHDALQSTVELEEDRKMLAKNKDDQHSVNGAELKGMNELSLDDIGPEDVDFSGADSSEEIDGVEDSYDDDQDYIREVEEIFHQVEKLRLNGEVKRALDGCENGILRCQSYMYTLSMLNPFFDNPLSTLEAMLHIEKARLICKDNLLQAMIEIETANVLVKFRNTFCSEELKAIIAIFIPWIKKNLPKQQMIFKRFAQERIEKAMKAILNGNKTMQGHHWFEAIMYLSHSIIILEELHHYKFASNAEMGRVYCMRAHASFYVDVLLEGAEVDIMKALDYNGMDDFQTLYWAARIKDDLGKRKKAADYARLANKIREDPQMSQILHYYDSEEGSEYSMCLSDGESINGDPAANDEVDMSWIPAQNLKAPKVNRQSPKKTSKGKAKFKQIARRGEQSNSPTVSPACSSVSPDSEDHVRQTRNPADQPSTSSAANYRRMIKQPMLSKKKRKYRSNVGGRKPSNNGEKLYNRLSEIFEKVHLACDNCLEEQSEGKVCLKNEDHNCTKETLVVKERSGGYFKVRIQPYKSKTSDLCESFAQGLRCEMRKACPFPHCQAEKEAWTYSKRFKCSIQDLIAELKDTTLLVKCAMLSICSENKGHFSEACSICLNHAEREYSFKKKHTPFCDKDHCWDQDNTVLVFIKDSDDDDGDKFLYIPSLKKKEHSNVHPVITSVHKLFKSGFKKQDIIDESNSHRQMQKQRIAAAASAVGKAIPPRLRELSNSSSDRGRTISTSSNYSVTSTDDIDDCLSEESDSDYSSEFGDLPFDGDVDTPDEVHDQEDNNDGEPYYDIKEKSEIQRLLQEHPKTYIECVVQRFEGGHQAWCVPLDLKKHMVEVEIRGEKKEEPLSEVEIRGRMNCGPTMEGDVVVVQIMETEVLDKQKRIEETYGKAIEEKDEDGNTIKKSTKNEFAFDIRKETEYVTRGKVVGILAHGINRTAYTFVCTVDQYHSCLMKPICGKAPKIHVIDADIRKKYGERARNAFVAIYEESGQIEEGLQFIKMVKLNLKDKHDRLFVVKYMRWGNAYIYPLGFVCKVLPAGKDLKTSQAILNLQYQVPLKYDDHALKWTECRYSSGIPDHFRHGRKSMTTMTVVSIDPPTCRDIDDALSVKLLKKKDDSLDSPEAYKVTIHIADVSQFLEKDDDIDMAARLRMTSYYPAGKQSPINMLPDKLCTDLCSLVEGQERLALSVTLTIDENGKMDESSVVIRRSIIVNKAAMTYQDAQAIIKGRRSDKFSDDVKLTILRLHRLSQKLRAIRLEGGKATRNLGELFEGEDYPEAHMLVEEFMILTNCTVAKFLMKHYEHLVPLRHQEQPLESKVNNWLNCNPGMQDVSFYFKQFENLTEESQAPEVMPILQCVLDELQLSWKMNNMDAARNLLSKEQLHPLHAIAMSNWFQIQQKANYICSGDPAYEMKGHFSLKADCYVQFTSPIRRYLDIVVHRLVVSALETFFVNKDGEAISLSAPYTKEEVISVCKRANKITNRAKKYDRQCKLLDITEELKEKPVYLPGIVESVDDNGINFEIPFLKNMRLREKTVRYGNLDVSRKPFVENGSVKIPFMKRIYDYDPFKKHARTIEDSKRTMPIRTNLHSKTMILARWTHLLELVEHGSDDDLSAYIGQMLEGLNKAIAWPSGSLTEVTSEMRGHKPIVRHHANFSLELTRGKAVQLQISLRRHHGIIKPIISLMNFTPQFDICVDHNKNAVQCFADIATQMTRKTYKDLKHYQQIWQPLLSMESAEAAVGDGEPIVVHNVKIHLHQTNKLYFGHFELNGAYCKERKIQLLKNSKDEEDEERADYICIKVPHVENEKPGLQHRWRNVWTAHAVATFATQTTEKNNKVEFRLHHFTTQPPETILKSGCRATIELLPKPLPFARMTDAVENLHLATPLVQRVVRGQFNPNGEMISQDVRDLIPEDLNIQALGIIKFSDRIEKRPMPKNNKMQTKAIYSALSQKFTLIQGPPGTGKTLTGVKLVYHFVEINKALDAQAKSGEVRRQVMYCGPSNSAVDVAANLLRDRLGIKCPKIIRVYSTTLEAQVYPIPREAVNIKSRGRKYEILGKESQQEIALHHLIRKDSNPFSKRIAYYDKLFAKNKLTPEEVSNDEVEKYEKLITDASMHEIKQYEVILCTCTGSICPRINRASNITQVIIDEGGMCLEPECLIPLVNYKPQQVVLIGDHRQLRPIINNQVASDLGMEISLFERHSDKAIMLDTQYRMHPQICEFPSRHFYNDQLKTVDTKTWNNEYLDIWPKNYHPIVFCHVAGAEKTLTVSTAEGNEQSKSNEAERDHVVRIYTELVNYYRVNPKKIVVLSQYKAQCTEILRFLRDEWGFEMPNVSTVVASQGDEWDYVILSTVRSLPEYEMDKRPSLGWLKKNLGFITDRHQINVALTRAKKGMIIVGNEKLLKCDEMWKELLYNYRKRECLMLADDFPINHKENRDRARQRGEKAPCYINDNGYWTPTVPAHVKLPRNQPNFTVPGHSRGRRHQNN